MKNFIPILTLFSATLFFSCSTTYYSSAGYENDDVYYVPGDADSPQYSDYATEQDDITQDEYYSDESDQDDYYNENNEGFDQRGSGNTYNNYNYYRYQQSPYYQFGYYHGVYNSPWYLNGIGPSFGPHFGWNSHFGWNVGFSWNYWSWYRRPYWGPFYNPYTPWWNPYDPFYAGTWYSPFYSGYYGYGNYYDFIGGGTTGLHYGHRTPITSNTDLNSNYTGGTIYAVRRSDIAERDPSISGNVPTAKPQRTPDFKPQEPGFQREPTREIASLLDRKPGRDNEYQESRSENETDYYQWRPSEDNLERKPSRDTDQTDRRPDRTEGNQPDYRRPERQPEARPDNNSQRQPDYRNNSRSQSPGLLEILFDSRSRQRNDYNRSEPSRPSTRDRGSDRPSPSYSPPSRSRGGGSVSPNRGSGGSSPSRGGSSGGSGSRSRGGR